MIYEMGVRLSNNVFFVIYHNIPEELAQAAIDNWAARAKRYKARFFVQYIRSKGYEAYTVKQFKKRMKWITTQNNN